MLSPRFSFKKEQIGAMAFPMHGVYVLYDQTEIIYIGKSSSGESQIKDRLMSHLAGREGVCTQHATEFAYEGTLNADAREKELLAEFAAAYRRLPRCNERLG
jgi:hypothetical protein